jgi:hypothetical protein
MNTNFSEEEVFYEGVKYFPKLKIIDDRFYINHPKNKGYFSKTGFVYHLAEYKIKATLEWLKKKGKSYRCINS